MSSEPRFSRQSLPFLIKASRQKRPDWLDRNRDEYERLLLNPLKHLAAQLKSELSEWAPGYRFPQKGIGRLKRSANSAAEYGGLYRGWMHYSASKPRVLRFEHNPNLYFLLNPDDREDPVLIAGGLYMPSSRQTRSIREAIANDASAFDALFKSRAFSQVFKGGFSLEKSSSRPARGFDPAHPRMHWLRLQAFFVWKSYSMREFTSADFSRIVAKDCRQILRLNALLEDAISGRIAKVRPGLRRSSPSKVSSLIETVDAPRHKMDF
jgi:uncharacterized protein (TIGR02453 family)